MCCLTQQMSPFSLCTGIGTASVGIASVGTASIGTASVLEQASMALGTSIESKNMSRARQRTPAIPVCRWRQLRQEDCLQRPAWVSASVLKWPVGFSTLLSCHRPDPALPFVSMSQAGFIMHLPVFRATVPFHGYSLFADSFYLDTGSYDVAQAAPELPILLPQSLERTWLPGRSHDCW